MTYALIVHGKEQKSQSGTVMSKKGQRFWVCREPDGWVEATSTMVDDSFLGGKLPRDLKTFTTEDAAKSFAKRWKGHPWWCVPNGEFEVVKVTPKFQQVPDGFTRDAAGDAK
jgi:hypothetical protein